MEMNIVIKKKNFTNKEMMNLPYGTLVKIIDSYECHSIYKKGGELVFQPKMEEDDREFGIKVAFGSCFEFPCGAYELIEKKIPLTEDELKEVDAALIKDPKWKKIEAEEDAKQKIEWFCEDHSHIKFELLKPYHIRIFSDNKKIDIFPQTRKYFNLSLNKRGYYKDLLDFLMEQFDVPNRGI